jgi:hypothetical protein
MKKETQSPAPAPYLRPRTMEQFEAVYQREYEQELDSCDRWIAWCREQKDTHGINFFQGQRSAHVFNNIKMCQLLRVLKQEHPNNLPTS